VEAAALREALRTVRAAGGGGRRWWWRRAHAAEIATVLFNPVAEMAQRLQTTPQRLASDARRAALALQDLCEGPLRGMFDGPTHARAGPGRQAPRARPARGPRLAAVGILMACATAWMSALLARMAERPDRERLINVADESWKIVQQHRPGRVVSV